MENSIHQRIENLRDEIADRVDAIKETVLDALTRHGITHITDDDIEMYCDIFVDNGETAIVAEADYDATKRELRLTKQDNKAYRFIGVVFIDQLRTEARLAALGWLAMILDGIDSGALRVIGGAVKPFVFLPGDKVRWNDPAIKDFDPEERQAQAERVYTVYDASEGMVCFSDGVSDGEAPPCEVVLVKATPQNGARAEKEDRIRKQVISIMENLGGTVAIPENIDEVLDWIRNV